jgi:uncharacterized membrane protein YhaH (DUF805 family)
MRKVVSSFNNVVCKNYANFNNRISRSEYWYFVLSITIILFLLLIIQGITGMILQPVFFLLIIIPSLAAGIRRMHDNDLSGWFILIPIYSFILALKKGTTGTNRYGEDPLKESV